MRILFAFYANTALVAHEKEFFNKYFWVENHEIKFERIVQFIM